MILLRCCDPYVFTIVQRKHHGKAILTVFSPKKRGKLELILSQCVACQCCQGCFTQKVLPRFLPTDDPSIQG